MHQFYLLDDFNSFKNLQLKNHDTIDLTYTHKTEEICTLNKYIRDLIYYTKENKTLLCINAINCVIKFRKTGHFATLPIWSFAESFLGAEGACIIGLEEF